MTGIYLAVGSLFLVASAHAADFQITLDRKKAAPTQTRGGVEQQTSQKWTGTLRVENTSSKPSPELQAKYIVFVKRQELAQKAGPDKIDLVKGEAKITPLKKGEIFSLDTAEIVLRQQLLSANYQYSNGGQTKASDTVAGVWVRLFAGTVLLADYSNPETVKAKFKWE